MVLAMTMETMAAAIDKVRAAHADFKQSETRRQLAVLEARKVGASWTAISEVIGTTKQGARQRYVGAEEVGKMANVLDARLKLYAHGHGRLLTYAEALEFARSQGVLNDTHAKAVRAIYELNAEAAAGHLVPMKQADLLADQCIGVSAELASATPRIAEGDTHWAGTMET